MSKNAPKSVEILVSELSDARRVEREAVAALQVHIDSAPLGTVYTIDGVPNHVADRAGKKVLIPMVSARQMAALRGEPIPALRTRKRKARGDAAPTV